MVNVDFCRAYFKCGEGCRSKQGLVWRRVRVRTSPVGSGQFVSKHHIVSFCHLTQLSVVAKDERRSVKGIKSGEINLGGEGGEGVGVILCQKAYLS